MRNDAAAQPRTRPPVLVISGVGLTAAVALRSIAELKAHFPVLAAPVGDPDVAAQAGVATPGDALALLDAAGFDQAHIMGLSFGASIAQEIAIRHSDRVLALVLGSSTAGGERYVAPARPVRHFLHRLAELPAEEGLWASVPYLYAAATWRSNALHIGEDVAQRLRRPLDPRSYLRQHTLARAHDTVERLTEIRAPTLVVHGEEDRILPLENGRRLAEAISRARFIALPGGAHAFPTEMPGANRELVSFLREHSRRRAGSAAARSGRATRA